MSLLADKWERAYSEMVGYVRGRMAMSILRANNACLRGGACEEAYGAVGGGQRGVRGVAGVDGGLGARPDGQEYGRLHGITER